MFHQDVPDSLRTAKPKLSHLDCQRALGRHVGLPRRTWKLFWAAKAHLDVILGLNLAPKCLPRAPQILSSARHYGTFCTCSNIAFGAVQVLLDGSLAALGAFLDASWAQLGFSWTPLGLNLGPPGRLWGSSWHLLGASWASLGPLGRLLGKLGASWASIGRQLGARRTPNERQVGFTSELQV